MTRVPISGRIGNRAGVGDERLGLLLEVGLFVCGLCWGRAPRRLGPLASNGTRPVTSDPEGVVSLHIDAPSVVTTSEDIEMTLDDARMYISEDQIASLEANIWPTGVKWSQFQLKEVYGDQEIFWEVDAGSDFSVYRQEMCDDDDGNAACHLDPLFSVSGIISNPFINPFFSFSVLFEDAEPSASELGWDEKPAFSLFE